jgi:hypothetical protein
MANPGRPQGVTSAETVPPSGRPASRPARPPGWTHRSSRARALAREDLYVGAGGRWCRAPWSMAVDRTPSPFAEMQRASGAAIQGVEALRRATEGWTTRPEPPTPAELHEATRGLALVLQAAAHASEAVALQWAEDEGAEARGEAERAGGHLRDAAAHLTRLGVIGAEAHLAVEDWADPPQITR